MFACPGVYVGWCRANYKYYVGSSLYVLRRIKEQKAELAKGKHQNKHFQAAYNKYGAKSFRWRVVETVNPKNRFVREQAWIEKLRSSDPRYGFNKAYPVRVSEPNPIASRKMKKYWNNPEYRALWEASLLKGSKKVSQLLKDDPSFAAKISKIRRGMWTDSIKQQLAKQAKKRYKNSQYKKEHSLYLAAGREKLKELRKDPKFVANQVKGMVDRWKDPEVRKKQAARMAALWDNPEFRAKQIEVARARIVAFNKTRRTANTRDSLSNSE